MRCSRAENTVVDPAKPCRRVANSNGTRVTRHSYVCLLCDQTDQFDGWLVFSEVLLLYCHFLNLLINTINYFSYKNLIYILIA